MREAALTDRQKMEKGLYGSYAPPVGGREVTAQSKNKSRTRRKGGAAMNSKIAFGSAMLVLVATLLGVAGPAAAWERPLGGKHGASEILEKCTAAGGNYDVGGNKGDRFAYTCSGGKGGNWVGCTKDGQCTGGGPGKGRAARQQQLGIGDVLGGAPLMKQGEPPPPPAAR